jgi:uncharacterized protein YqeY
MADSTLKTSVQTQMVAAMKSGEKERTQVLRMLLSEIKRKESDDANANPQEAVSGYAKTLRKAMADMEKHGQADHVAQLKKELAIVDEFLPKQIDDAALEKLVTDTLATMPNLAQKDAGRAMGAVLKAAAAAGTPADSAKVRALIDARIPDAPA